MKIQTKLINHITFNGKKETGEKNLMKSVKELQKNSNKITQEIFQLALVYSTPIFRFHKLKNKNRKKTDEDEFLEIPGFIQNQEAKMSLAIKSILFHTKKKGESFYKKLNKEVLLNAKSKGNSVETKNEVQKNILNKSHLFRNYRWT